MNKSEQKKKQTVKKLHQDNRCQFIAEADYFKDSNLYKIVTMLIKRIEK